MHLHTKLKHRHICTLIYIAIPFITLSSRTNVGAHTRGMNKESVLCMHNGIFFSFKKNIKKKRVKTGDVAQQLKALAVLLED